MSGNYICPACLFFNQENYLEYKNLCKCKICSDALEKETELWRIKLLTTFKVHNKFGYRCPDCDRFLPHPLECSDQIFCPYPNCFFFGKIDSLKRMRHPTSKKSEQIVSVEKNSINIDIVPILQVIEELNSITEYTSVNCTIKQKIFIYQAFSNLLKKYPKEMSSYLIESKRGNNLQSKLFQEYISILEKNLPFSYKKKNKIISIDSITHQRVNPFDGLSKFSAVVEKDGIIKNNTSEIYIGGRKSYYCQPFYIGKLLDVIDESGNTLLTNVLNYSFSTIKTNLEKGTKVQISHLRIPPHYQIGILSHINRIKKKISDSLNNKTIA